MLIESPLLAKVEIFTTRLQAVLFIKNYHNLPLWVPRPWCHYHDGPCDDCWPLTTQLCLQQVLTIESKTQTKEL